MMSKAVFPFISSVDVVFASFLPLAVRISLWGLVAGVVAMVVYAFVSNQNSISTLKKEIGEHRRRMLELPVESHSEYTALAGKNLKASVALLGRVIVPALLSTLPVLVIAGWMDVYHGYDLPEGSGTVALTFVPPLTGSVEISPPEIVRLEGGVVAIVPPQGHPTPVSFSVNGKAVYSGDPFRLPAPVVAKKGWLNIILPSSAGYVNPGSPVEEIHLNLPRKRLFKDLPPWASGWEFAYFFSVFFAALAVKLVFKIH